MARFSIWKRKELHKTEERSNERIKVRIRQIGTIKKIKRIIKRADCIEEIRKTYNGEIMASLSRSRRTSCKWYYRRREREIEIFHLILLLIIVSLYLFIPI